MLTYCMLTLHGFRGGQPGFVARLINKPFTVTVHAFDLYSAKNDLLRLVTREANHIIAISEYNRTKVAALETCSAESISVIHCGVDLVKFDKDKDFESSVADPIKILSVGSLTAKKGHKILVEACRLLKKKNVDFTCSIIGSGPDEVALSDQINAYDLQDCVRLLGGRPHPEIISAYYAHDIFVLACTISPDGDRDGIPVVLMEAGRAGLPLVSTSVSGIPELIYHMQTGWLVPPDDPVALADAICALAADSVLRARFGKNVQALVETEFRIENSVTQLSDLFHKIFLEWRYKPHEA